jgi:hypothetical protein
MVFSYDIWRHTSMDKPISCMAGPDSGS